MTVARLSLKTVIKMAILPYPGLPKWKAWRLRHPDGIGSKGGLIIGGIEIKSL
jgi:hypothetical protein